MILFALALAGVIFLAYVNGANDNFKGVATLYGTGTTSYRRALALATVATFLGSLTALVSGRELLHAFSGKGLVPDTLLQAGPFPVAIGIGAAVTVLLATRFGFPISTTHALTGALVGAGLAAGGVNLHRLVSVFAIPLLVSPALAALLSTGFYPAMRWVRTRLALEEDSCIYVDAPLDARTAVDWVHFLSASMVSFARGLNDTPKIAGILLLFGSMGDLGTASLLAVAVSMAIGGLLSARRVAERMSWEITDMNIGQGMAANLMTSLLVLGASRYGVPVSTTHVSCGALFGIGAVTGQARWRTIFSILLAWIVTLPVAAVTTAVLYRLGLATQAAF